MRAPWGRVQRTWIRGRGDDDAGVRRMESRESWCRFIMRADQAKAGTRVDCNRVIGSVATPEERKDLNSASPLSRFPECFFCPSRPS